LPTPRRRPAAARPGRRAAPRSRVVGAQLSGFQQL